MFIKLYPNRNIINNVIQKIKYGDGHHKKQPFICLSLNDIITNKQHLNSLKNSFNKLEIDQYLENNNPPKRLRKYTSYNISINSDYYIVNNNNSNNFIQNVSDTRSKPRIFSPIDNIHIYSTFMMDLINNTTTIVKHFDPYIREIKIDVHQVRNIIYPNSSSTNSPEGLHRDGADYIISALVLNKDNVKGGISILKNYDKSELFKVQLNNNQGIFQKDTDLWHTITPMKCIDSNYLGYRDII